MNPGETEVADARVAVDMALRDAEPKDSWTDAELRSFAERRHMFWRTRCLEHARRIDALNRRVRMLEDLIADGLTWVADRDWDDKAMSTWRRMLMETHGAIDQRQSPTQK